MNELQNLRKDLLSEWGNLKDAKAAYEFIMNYSEQEDTPAVSGEQPAAMQDGVYILQTDGKAILFEGENTEPTGGTVKGIGIKWGSRSLVVALDDMANGKEITLTANKDNGETGFYQDNYLDAVADWQGKSNTEHLKAIGLNPKIELPENWYIPSLGEMYFVYTNLKAVNAALEFAGAEPIAQDWYWTSTECSANNAWNLRLSSGNAYNSTKASGKLRVRAVSTFIS